MKKFSVKTLKKYSTGLGWRVERRREAEVRDDVAEAVDGPEPAAARAAGLRRGGALGEAVAEVEIRRRLPRDRDLYASVIFLGPAQYCIEYKTAQYK